MYQAALDKGLYPSQRKLSESIGVDTSLVSKSVALAKLPASVIDAFPSPLDVQFRWAQLLVEALQEDPERWWHAQSPSKASDSASRCRQPMCLLS